MRDPMPFEALLAPGRIGTLDIRNRIVMSPMGSNLAEATGHVGERLTRYYEARAKGGVGLIIVGVGAVAFPAGACIPNQVAISDDVFLPGLQNLTRRVHAHGAKIAIQLQHAGKVATQDMAAGRPLWVPSLVPMKAGDLLDDLTMEEIQGVTGYLAQPGAGISFQEMTTADIRQLVAMFAGATERARSAGFDAVEIHAAHGYLISTFLSPAYNRRTDEYGGSLENRARLLLEVLHAVRQRVGPAFPVWCRLDAKEFRIADGIVFDDAQRVAVMAAAAGADAIHVSAYAEPTSGVAFTEAPLVHQPCGYVDFAAAIKQRVTVPVIAVGRIEPEDADGLITAGKADFVAMARKLLADPELPSKLAAGRAADVRPCIYCYRCVGNIFLNTCVACAVNPATGREAEFEIIPAAAPKRVLIAGGGPAGMEAARIAALRGHTVTLCDKGERLGGTALFAALVYEANGRLIEYLETQVRALPVDVRLGREVTPTFVRELRPDVILVAVGARREVPPLPGADRVNVLSGDDLRSLMAGSDTRVAAEKLPRRQRAMLAMGKLLGITDRVALTRELTRHWMPLGTRVVVIGGGLVGVELAEFLSERGRTVTVIEESPNLATEMALPRRWRALYALREHGVRLLSGAVVEAITDDGVLYLQHGEQQIAPADHVIIATGVAENRGLADALGGCGAAIHLIGDCRGVGYIEGAIMDAARVARAI
jgi:2,4-dienoyl-CoA reductase-like NADH-dependent reductase (Old Yellow Enzyme family)/NADPH-dependent 2,4-dienoyl-CoA reductase/sulfur reductase-like enzyme